jgi:hypothetical protein
MWLEISENGWSKDSSFCFHLQASQIPIQHILMNSTTEQVRAMESVRDIIRNVNISSEDIVSYSPEYVSWTANKVCLVSGTIPLNGQIFLKHEILGSSLV